MGERPMLVFCSIDVEDSSWFFHWSKANAKPFYHSLIHEVFCCSAV